MSTFQDIGIALGRAVSGEARAVCPQCGPLHQRTSKTLGVDAGRGIWHCFRCGWSGSLKSGAHRVSLLPDRPDKSDPAAKIAAVWSGTYPLSHPRAEAAREYLAARGLAAILEDLPRDVRLHPALPYWEEAAGQWRKVGDFPALVAQVRSPAGKVVTLHRTYLKPDGSGKAPVEAPRKLMKPDGSMKGAAIRLYPAGDSLYVAEGIETALAVRVMRPDEPVWSTVSAYGLTELAVPDSVRSVHIAADHDEAGRTAARRLGKRLFDSGREAWITIPERPGSDWLDVLTQRIRP